MKFVKEQGLPFKRQFSVVFNIFILCFLLCNFICEYTVFRSHSSLFFERICISLGPQDQVISTNNIYLPQKNRKQEIQRKREKGKGTRERGKRYLSLRRTKDCLWMERRQTWPVGKWQFRKGKGERTSCWVSWLILIRSVDMGSKGVSHYWT